MSKHELPIGGPPTGPSKPGIPAEPPFPDGMKIKPPYPSAKPALTDRASWIPAERAVRLAAAGAALAAEVERYLSVTTDPASAARGLDLLKQWKGAVWAPIPLEGP